MTLRPNSELVAAAWLRGVAGVPVNGVATVLPGPPLDENDNTSWAASGFVQIAVIGGTPEVHLPVRRPVISVDCWAVNVSRKRAPWGKAFQLAEHIANSVYTLSWDNVTDYHRAVTLPDGYGRALVNAAELRGEPARRPADPANFAHAGFEMEFAWVAL